MRDANPTARATFGGVAGSRSAATSTMHPARDVAASALASEVVARVPPHARDRRAVLHAGAASMLRRDRGATEYYEWQISRIPLPDGQHRRRLLFPRHLAARARAHAARSGRSAEGRVPRDARARAAQSARADPQRRRSAVAPAPRASARAEQAVGVVQRQITTLTRLVDDLLDVSRITHGRIELQMKPVELRRGRRAGGRDGRAARQGEAPEACRRRPSARCACTAIPARLVQCVANVLTNAAKYTDAAARSSSKCARTRAMRWSRVTDNGIGIPAELQPRVFDLFVQGDRTLDRAQGGLGIGLSVVKRLVEMHGGEHFGFQRRARPRLALRDAPAAARTRRAGRRRAHRPSRSRRGASSSSTTTRTPRIR